MGFTLKTLLLLAALFMYGMVFITGATNSLGSQTANWMIGIWAVWVVLSFYGRRGANKAKVKEVEEKEKDTIDAYAIAKSRKLYI